MFMRALVERGHAPANIARVLVSIRGVLNASFSRAHNEQGSLRD